MITRTHAFLLLLALSTGIARAQGQGGLDVPDPSAVIEKKVEIPTQNLQAVLTRQGDLVVLTSNGRYVFRGEIYDAWSKKPLRSIDEIAESVSVIDLKKLDLNTADLNPLVYGAGARDVVVFVDPRCPWCGRLMAQIAGRPDLAKAYRFLLMPIPALGDDSSDPVRKLECAADRAQALQALMTESGIGGLPQRADCRLEPVQRRMASAYLMNVPGVPFLIAPDGRTHQGLPPDLDGFLAGGAL